MELHEHSWRPLTGLSNALDRHYAHHSGAYEILYTSVKLKASQKLLSAVNKAPG